MIEEKKKAEKEPTPEFTTNPEAFDCKQCDMAGVIGLLTGSCQIIEDSGERNKCWEAVKPIAEEKIEPEEALVEHFVQYGVENIDKIVERMNWIILRAEQKAKERLIAEGKLNQDGTPKGGEGNEI